MNFHANGQASGFILFGFLGGVFFFFPGWGGFNTLHIIPFLLCHQLHAVVYNCEYFYRAVIYAFMILGGYDGHTTENQLSFFFSMIFILFIPLFYFYFTITYFFFCQIVYTQLLFCV